MHEELQRYKVIIPINDIHVKGTLRRSEVHLIRPGNKEALSTMSRHKLE